MHCFPDDSRVYDRLVPLVAPRRVVVFDFAGYGRSERDLEAQDDHIAAAGEMTQAASPPDPAFWLLGATAW